MTKLICFLLLNLAAISHAQDFGMDPNPAPAADREPSAVTQVSAIHKRAYAGSADEEDLRVQATLPEAGLRVDARGLQREIFKQLYNQDLKEEQQNDLEE